MNYLFMIIISSFLYLTNPFTIHINNHYSTIASKIFDINTNLKYNKETFFKNISYYNDNKSISFNLNHKNNLKLLFKDKYNYLVSFDVYKYKYLIILKSTPIYYNYTEIDIDIRQDRNMKFNHNSLNFNHYKRINNIIYKYIYNNIIIKNKKDNLSIDLFKFFNNY
jgi:hypothetical protein